MRRLVMASILIFVFAIVSFGEVSLLATGKIELRNSPKGFVFSLDALKELPRTTYAVDDPWLGKHEYEGVRISDLALFLGVSPTVRKATIICRDKKAFSVDMEDAWKYPIIIAYLMDGKPIKDSHGGPFKLVYPYFFFSDKLLEKYSPDDWAWWVEAIAFTE